MSGCGEQGARGVHAELLEPRRLMATTRLAGQGTGIGDSPVAIVAADLNGDGKTDLAAANAVGSTGYRVTVTLGRGDGTFEKTAENILVSSSDTPTALAAGDIDSDGKTDLVMVAFSGALNGSITMLRNSGDGRFGTGSTVSINASPAAVTFADVNNDGRPDIVVANRSITGGNGGLTVMTRTSFGGFNAPVTTTLPQSLRDVDARDMNGDGKTDLVVAADFGSFGLGVMAGNGDGTFGAPTAVVSGVGYAAAVAGDFNNDGVPDIAGAASATATATVHFGSADGTFAAPATYTIGGSAADIVRADLNADGKADLVTADNFGGTVSVLLNNGAGAFSPSILPAGDRTTGVAVADLDNDGRVDLAVSNRNSSSASILLGNGDGTFPGPIVTRVGGTGAISVSRAVAGDFDQDGAADLIVINANNGTDNAGKSSLAFRHGNGNGTFAEPLASYTVDADPTAPVVGDFNGDGKPDMAVSSTTYSYVYVLLGNGDGTFLATIRTSISSNTALVALDFDNDGKTDLAAMRSTGLLLLRSSGNGRFTSTSFGFSNPPTAIATSDFNRDGKADLAVAESNGVTPLLGNGDGTFTAQTKTSTVSSGSVRTITQMAAGDLNADGIPDLAVAYGSSSLLGTMRGTASGTFTDGGAVSSVFSPTHVDIADLDGDGRNDIVLLGSSAAFVYHPSLLYPPAVVAVGTSSTSLQAGDFTGDGRIDLLTTKTTAITVTPGVPVNTLPADPTVTAAGGVLTISAATATIEGDPNLPGHFLVTTATRQTRLAGDGILSVQLNGAAATLNADLGLIAGHAVSLTVSGSATFATSQHLATLTVNGTATVPAGGNRVLRLAELSIFSPRASLDLNDNPLIYDYTSLPGTTTVRNLIARARAGGTWTGYGLTSTTAKNDPSAHTTLGYVRSSEYKSLYGNTATFAGEVIDDTAVLVKYTTYGDSNFDGKTDFNDFLNLQNAFGQTSQTSFGGDFDYNATTDFNDFLVLQNHFNASLPVAAVTKPPVSPANASISGVAFNDSNRNGKYDKGDSLAAGKTVWLDLDDDGVKDKNEPSAVTDSKGRYAFKNLAAGTYHVRRVFPRGYRESTKPLIISLTAGQAVDGLAIGSRLV